MMAGGTAPLDFTLHDAQHGFRVAQRMVDLIPRDSLSALSPQEIALLLMSAYLHDIGMIPERKRIEHYHHYLLTGRSDTLAPGALDELHAWLDERGDDLVIPMCDGPPTSDILKRANLVLAHFARDKHVDWGDEISASLTRDRRFDAYVQWR